MTKGVLVHKPTSIYEDIPSVQYQFPATYLKRLESMVGDWIVYYGRELHQANGSLGYFAAAIIGEIIPDPSLPSMYLAMIQPGSYISLEKFVGYKQKGKFVEHAINTASGRPNGGVTINAVRSISDEEFANIIKLSASDTVEFLPRVDNQNTPMELNGLEDNRSPFIFDEPKKIIETLLSRPARDARFRRVVLNAYKERCAITGLRLINGGGRAEVEAAHIKPVKHKGPDDIRNGLALSGTAHWMFDRGLIGIQEDFSIVVSRKVNNKDEVVTLINETGKAIVPDALPFQPHPAFLEWHRAHHELSPNG